MTTPRPANGAQDRPDRPNCPDVSIVMPVFNKLDLTRVCVESLHTVPTEYSFELIVVDNGSSDGTGAWLGEQEAAGRLRRIDNPENLGFAQGCNLGAAAAEGRYILFLNNDMEVLPGWLEPMVSCLDRDPRVGITGACLVFADQMVQHGGVAVYDTIRRGKPTVGGIHMCYKKPLDYPGARKNQLMQVVTGACLMIRPEAFEAVGGFDEGFWNGNEDVDLCLKAGELGWRVAYMGDSLIFHYESQSGQERWIKTEPNIARFNKRWRGRVKVDFLHDGKDLFEPTEHNQIRSYVVPGYLDRRPAGAPEASVIVLTWNALDYTRQCAESLLRHTDARTELIFVDNGSEQDTLDYLAALEAAHDRVVVVRNGKNLGFAGGNNVGLAHARGEYLCLLNSDTVVTAGWLDRLLKPMQDDPRIGLVGPRTNSITGSQKLDAVPYDEDSLAGLDAFATGFTSENSGTILPALWVVGFCVAFSRDLLVRIGGLDEGYGLGNYEDTDYCLRAFLAGYRAVVAGDAFVHHFGSRTFAANDLDYGGLLDEKFEVFRRKWDLAVDARETGDFQLEKMLLRGFVPPLHCEALPASPWLEALPLPDWMAEKWTETGEMEFAAGRIDPACRVFKAVLDRRPDHVRAANDHACVLWQTGEIEAAAAILRDLLVRHPDAEDARWNLAEIEKAQAAAAGETCPA